MSRDRVWSLDPAPYRPHALHGDGRAWVGKNCYVDIWIEVLHARGLDPTAMLAFTLAIDFEGDQWTFFKPVHDELRTLYGVDVQEMTVWRPLVEHIALHLGDGKLVSTEADAFYLPDTQGTDYRTQHTGWSSWLRKNGRYASLYRLQLKDDEPAAKVAATG